MKNVTVEKQGNILVFKVDTTQKMGLSTSGKSMNIGTSEGIQEAYGVKFGLNVFAPLSAEDKKKVKAIQREALKTVKL